MRNLEGPDVSIETSLQEYGFAWEIGETETTFFYGIDHDGTAYTRFDWTDLENNLDICSEYEWADFDAIVQFVGMSRENWEKIPLVQKIYDLLSYYGTENVFSPFYTMGMTYEEVLEGE